MKRRGLGGIWAALALMTLPVWAEETINVCFNYGCVAQAQVAFSEAQLNEIRALLGAAADAAEERAAIGLAVGRLLGWAGRQSPIFADRGGNFADQSVYGRMDCIDHSTTTTRLLWLMSGQKMLRFHRVLDPVLRQRFLVMIHYSAMIEELPAAEEASPPKRFVVDSWYFDNGEPAAVIPLERWLAGEEPDGYR